MAPIQYIPGLFDFFTLDVIDRAIAWEQRDAPRAEAYYARKNVPYTYGRGAGQRTYFPNILDKIEPSQTVLRSMGNEGLIFIEDMDRPLNSIWGAIDRYIKTDMELLFCNKYMSQSQHLGWHADDSPSVDPHRPIVVVSFGAEREIWFRENAKAEDGCTFPVDARRPDLEKGPIVFCIHGRPFSIPGKVEKLVLGHGSALVMDAGMQQTHQHRIPKHHAMCGPRISLTFRGLTPGIAEVRDDH
jgi:hypothetical protein